MFEITSGKIESAQKVVVYGPEGIGKSTFAAFFPGGLFVDTEGSTKHLSVDRLPAPTSWDMINRQISWVLENKPCKTLIIDTADWAERLCKEYVIMQNGWKSIEDPGYGKGFTVLAEVWGRFLNRLQEVTDSGIHVVLTAHAMMRKFEQPDELGAYDRWELKLEKKTAGLTKEWADLVLFANYKTTVITDSKTKSKMATGGERVMYTTHHPAWDAKNRMGLAEELPFSYSEIRHIFSETPPQVEPKKEEPKPQETPSAEPPKETVSPPVEKPQDDKPEVLPQALWDLMQADGITVENLLEAIYRYGHYPRDTTLEIIASNPGYLENTIANWSAKVYPFIVDQGINVPF